MQDTPATISRRLRILSKVVLANDTRGSVTGEHWGSWLTTSNLEELLVDAGMNVLERLPLGKLQPVAEVWERIERADLLVINGEGSVHSGTDMAIALLKALRNAHDRGIPVWIVNHACWNCDKWMPLYDYADFVAVRDIASAGYLAQFGIAAELAADCSFLSAPAQAAPQNRLLVCSGLLAPKKELVARWATELGCISVVWCNDFYPRFHAGEAVKSGSARESFRLFAASRFVISSSYHGCIFAAIHGVPFLPIQVKGQPPKTKIVAVETMQGHAQGICFDGPAYVVENYAAIQATLRERVKLLRKRAQRNVVQNPLATLGY